MRVVKLCSQKLILLRQELDKYNLDGFIIPSNDQFMNEYTPKYDQRLAYITNFTGSNGIALIMKDKAILFTDGRYLTQARIETNKEEFEIIDLADENIAEWFKRNSTNMYNIGFDPKLHTELQAESYGENCNIIAIENLVDAIWQDKGKKPKSFIKDHPIIYSGASSKDKINQIIDELKLEEIDALIITSPDSICWLLNIRGNDVEYNPLVLSYMIIYDDGSLILFTDADYKIDRVKILGFDKLNENLNLKGKKIQIDKKNANYWFILELEKNNALIFDKADPCKLPKACKNNIEIENAKKAHIYDAVALCKFLHWFENNLHGQSELSLISKLEEFRKENEEYLLPSFATICSFNENGAIIHYRADEKSSKKITGNGLLLIDSGGQYLWGTTDITRTIAIGEVSLEQKEYFTRVLKGHISIATAKFPISTTGSQLDALARYNLWQIGADYSHGTGHGVGSYLSVHEGPQRIAKSSDNVALHAGMILSNEPGYYKENTYGIRIENLIYVKESEYNKFLEFENLTLVPIDHKLINFSLLTTKEKQYLYDYHNKILTFLRHHLLDEDIIIWLKQYINYYMKQI